MSCTAVQSDFRAGEIHCFIETKHGKVILPVIERRHDAAFEFIEEPGGEFCAGMVGQWITAAEAGVDLEDTDFACCIQETLNVQRTPGAGQGFGDLAAE